MVKEIIKIVAGHFNKKVIFFLSGKVNKNTKSFKLSEEVIGEDRYMTIIRLEEFEHHVAIINFEIITINNKIFLESNKE